MANHETFFAAALWATAGKALGVTGGIVVNIALARILTKDEFGAYVVLQSIVIFAATVGRFGLQQTIVKLVSDSIAENKPGKAGQVLLLATGIILIGGGTVSLILYSWGFDFVALRIFNSPILIAVALPASLWIFFQTAQTPLSEAFRGLKYIRLAVLLDGVITTLLCASMFVAGVAMDLRFSFQDAVSITLIALVVNISVGIFFLAKHFHLLQGAGTILMRDLLRLAAPVFVINVITVIFANSSIWIAGATLSTGEVALLGVASKLLAAVSLPLVVVNMAVQPFIADLFTKRELGKLQLLLRGSATLAAIPSVLAALPLLFCGQEILVFLFGANYAEANLILGILTSGYLCNVLTGSCGQALIFTGNARMYMKITLISGALSVTAAYYLAKEWGIVGIAASQSAGLCLMNVTAWFMAIRKIKIDTHVSFNFTVITSAFRSFLKQ